MRPCEFQPEPLMLWVKVYEACRTDAATQLGLRSEGTVMTHRVLLLGANEERDDDGDDCANVEENESASHGREHPRAERLPSRGTVSEALRTRVRKVHAR